MLDHLADLESDMSRFHRVDDMYALPGPKFFQLVWRLACYGDGVMSRRIKAQNEPPPEPPAAASYTPAQAPPAPSRPAPASGVQEVSVAAMALMHPDLVQRTTVPRSQ